MGAEAAARDAGADAGPAHTMVPPSAQAAIAAAAGKQGQAALPAAGQPAGGPALAGIGMGGVPMGSMVNSRLPGTSTTIPVTSKAGMPGPMAIGGGPAYGDDPDSDDEPNAKKPRTDDGSLVAEGQWVLKHPQAIQILVQVSLGADAAAANIPSVIPLEVSVKTRVLDVKQMLASKVSGAGVNANSMKLKAQGPGYILKNNTTLAFYNIAPGNVIELSRKQRGGAK